MHGYLAPEKICGGHDLVPREQPCCTDRTEQARISFSAIWASRPNAAYHVLFADISWIFERESDAVMSETVTYGISAWIRKPQVTAAIVRLMGGRRTPLLGEDILVRAQRRERYSSILGDQ